MILNDSISDLLTIAENKKEDEVCYSLYIERSNTFNTQLEQHLRPLILNVLKENTNTDTVNFFNKSVADSIVETKEEFPENATGYGIFFVVNPQLTVSNKSDDVVSAIKVVPMYSNGIVPASYYGETFDITPLLYSYKAEQKSYILHISRDRTDFFLLDKQECTHIQTFETEVAPNKEYEYNEKQGATGIVHGTGQDKIERRVVEENKYLLTQVSEFLIKMAEMITAVGKLTVVYTTQFMDSIDSFVDNLDKKLGSTKILTLQKNIQAGNELQQEVETLVTEHDVLERSLAYHEASEMYNRFSLDTDVIFAAASNAGIQTLFITLNQSLDGYVTDKVLFTKAAVSEKSRYVENILPLLVIRVWQTSGEVIAYGPDQDDKPLIAVLTRYDKEQIVAMEKKVK